MITVKKEVWPLLDIVGLVILTIGALGIMEVISVGITLSSVILAIGIILIVTASIFIFLDGHNLRKEFKEFQRFDEIRKATREVPNDLDEGYGIDFTASPENAVTYTLNETTECVCEADEEEN